MSKRKSMSRLLMFALLVLALAMVFSVGANAKLRVAVLEFEDKAIDSQANAGMGISDLIMNKLLAQGKYDILERQRLTDILHEQGLSADGFTDPTTAVKSGKLKGVEVLIYGSVTKFSMKDTSVGIGKFRVGKTDAEVEVQLRIVDAVTGSILAAESASAKDTVPRVDVWGKINFDFSSSDFAASALGKATYKVIDQLIAKIDPKLSTLSAQSTSGVEGYVILAKGGVIYIDLTKYNTQVGQKLSVYKQGESIIHPVTGAVLAGEMEQVGTLLVTETQENMSKCSIVTVLPGKSIEAGQKVKAQN